MHICSFAILILPWHPFTNDLCVDVMLNTNLTNTYFYYVQLDMQKQCSESKGSSGVEQLEGDSEFDNKLKYSIKCKRQL